MSFSGSSRVSPPPKTLQFFKTPSSRNFFSLLESYSYIPEEGEEYLKSYKYNGTNLSITYNNVLKPIAQYLIRFVPDNIAPNVITLFGVFFSLLSCIVISFYCPLFIGTAPAWVYFMCGCNAFIYQTLDNLDGQQARRTGTSSPLGELFDHGCDAVNATLSALVFASVAQMGPSLGIVLLLTAQVTFYVATWDEYHTKELYLAPLNGADEGLTLVYIAYFCTAFLGP
eukprot:Sdes_comp22973_c0_seq1m21323